VGLGFHPKPREYFDKNEDKGIFGFFLEKILKSAAYKKHAPMQLVCWLASFGVLG